MTKLNSESFVRTPDTTIVRNVHEPECQANLPWDGVTPRWTIEIEVIAGRPIIGHAMNRVTGDLICFVDTTPETPLNSPIGEFMAMVRDHYDKA
jgi:hypothetical protein